MSKPPKGMARFDSATAMLMALAHTLHDKPFDDTDTSPMLNRLLLSLNCLPTRLKDWGYAVGGMAEGITELQAGELDIEGIAE